MAAITSLPMSQTKEGLRRHLNMPDEIYALMAKEADRIYKQLTTDKRHLKSNCKTKPPYDWNDVAEKSKDDAMRQLACSGSSQTAPYWQMAAESDTSPNWIAKWFLYHKFRYRDGRNKSKGSGNGHRGGHKTSSHKGGEDSRGQDHGAEYAEYTGYDTISPQALPRSALAGEYRSNREPYYPDYTAYTTATAASSPSLPGDYGNIVYANNRIMGPGTPSAPSPYSQSYASHVDDPGQTGKKVFDPVKDDWVHK